MVAAILWDIDGTLVDSEPLHEAALVRALATLGISPPPDFHELVAGRDAASIHAWCVEHLGVGVGLQDWLRLKYRTYFAAVATLAPRERAVELFVGLERHGRAQAVVSNSDRLVVHANLEAAGLATPGRVSVSRNDVRRGKPDPEAYLRAAWLLAAAPGDCVVVEDSTTGAAAGVAAGMRTLFWPQGDATPPAGAEPIADMAALEAVLREGTGR
jgi:beta-phosphoglucomutase-like phosphatase (HAD superfamily)